MRSSGILDRASNSTSGGRTGSGHFGVNDRAAYVPGDGIGSGTGSGAGVGVSGANRGGYVDGNIWKLDAVIQQHFDFSRRCEVRRGTGEAAQASSQEQQQEQQNWAPDQSLVDGRHESVLGTEVINGSGVTLEQ